MGNKVFCGGLPWATGDAELASAMAAFGDVTDAKVITDKETGRSRGFGFVTFASEDSATQAVSAQTLEVGGRTVRIDSANDRGGGGGGGGGGGARPAPRSDDRGGRPRHEDEGRGRDGGRRRERF
jgi:cold-inducible RNA-binding protein